MRLRNAGGSWGAWKPFDAGEDWTLTQSWSLTKGAGKKTVFAQFRDGNGNVSAQVSDSINYKPRR